MSKNHKKHAEWNIPNIISDNKHSTYTKSAFLGKGAFGKCFQLIDNTTGKSYAGKIILKDLIRKSEMKEKIVQEICIHKKLNHTNIVGFQSFFEDERLIYIILEICQNRSMVELLTRRKILTEPEVRYYMKQIMSGVKYLHDNSIAHRDLKLGNLLISEDMQVKIGDFGLSTEIRQGEKRKTMCGTPNYIAPEILEKKGHGFEVDIWSLGCILFTFLVGKPPFETAHVEETYLRICGCEYEIPDTVNRDAGKIFRSIFVKNPNTRPNINELAIKKFFREGYTPSSLPVSCLVVAPKFGIKQSKKSRYFSQININKTSSSIMETSVSLPEASPMLSAEKYPDFIGLNNLKSLRKVLLNVLKSKPSEREDINMEDSEDPSAHPVIWISSWVDYSDKYGFAYKLNDNSVGVVFIDCTKLVLLSNGEDVQLVNADGSETFFKINEFDPELKKKIHLLGLFQEYMGHLVQAGAAIPVRDSNCFMKVPILSDWIRYDRSIVMVLSNGILQINFSLDHSKLILCPLMGAVTCIDRNEIFHTYRLDLIKKHGCSKTFEWKLHYILKKINEIISNRSRYI
ncbi:hypothetical protein L9F63_023479 [Diploptera punctata]|uniref:Serine/threonine-protein kinase PLK n=1 Tax=Diploptera punctata TaxID=6984 RepID=A0AAD7ZJ26_DIPPU|nr:hypothetical protein L9F63_023479 [Diploptera punctata]